MSKLDLRTTTCIYTNPQSQVSIYQGSIQGGQIPVAIKYQLHPSISSANPAISEAMSQVQLDHPHICKVFDCYLEPAEFNEIRSVILIEWLSRDIYKEIEIRNRERRYWSEEELLLHLQALVSALAYAEKKGVSHRDIKPQNLFLDERSGKIKIGDFGSSGKGLDLRQASTLTGSPIFFSPEMRDQFAVALQSGVTRKVYDPFKSDVYSLGLTIVMMANLQAPIRFLELQNLQRVTEETIADFSNKPRLQRVLREMLTIDPQYRPDFLQLQTILDQEIPSKVTDVPDVEKPVPETISEASSVCIQCKGFIRETKWRSAVSAEVYSSLIYQMCSNKCYQTYLQKETAVRCVSCKTVVKSGWLFKSHPVELECGHVFHNTTCFNQFLSANPKNDTDYVCPECSVPISPSTVQCYQPSEFIMLR